jgi:hypothetical protein
MLINESLEQFFAKFSQNYTTHLLYMLKQMQENPKRIFLQATEHPNPRHPNPENPPKPPHFRTPEPFLNLNPDFASLKQQFPLEM